MSYSITPGHVLFSCEAYEYDERPQRRYKHLELWEFDLVTKYAEVVMYGLGPTGTEVWMGAGPDALFAVEGPGLGNTRLRFERRWERVMAECARYTLTVVMWEHEGG